jgi:hypothetical protein
MKTFPVTSLPFDCIPWIAIKTTSTSSRKQPEDVSDTLVDGVHDSLMIFERPLTVWGAVQHVIRVDAVPELVSRNMRFGEDRQQHVPVGLSLEEPRNDVRLGLDAVDQRSR